MIDWTKHKVWSADQIKAELPSTEAWGSPIEIETRRRIRASVATYAYEVVDKPIMGDRAWDLLVQTINPRLGTCHLMLDEFFATQFSPMTGMWIHHHPELDKIKLLFDKYYSWAGDDIEQFRRRGLL